MSLTLKINFPVEKHEALLDGLRQLPVEFAPVYFSTSERIQSKSNRLDDNKKFAEFLPKSKRFGFTLIGAKISYHLEPTMFRDGNNVPTHGYLFIEVKKGFKHNSNIGDLFAKLLNIEGIDFGYMCEHDEFVHRNRLIKKWDKKQAGASSIEFVIGSDFTKYVPGLYWKTAFSESYLSRNNVDIESLKSTAISEDVIRQEPNEKVYVFTFFDDSKNWEKYKDQLDSFIASQDGFFSLSRLQEKITTAQSEKELKQVVSKYA